MKKKNNQHTLLTSLASLSLLTLININQPLQASNIITEPDSSDIEVKADISSSWIVTLPKAEILTPVEVNNTGSGLYTTSIPVTVKGDIGVKEIIEVNTSSEISLTDNSSPNQETLTGLVDKKKVKFTYSDIKDNQISTTQHNIQIELTPGNWRGTLPFQINIAKQVITVTSIDKNGVNLNATASEITGDEKDKLLLSLEETSMLHLGSDIDALIEVESDNFTDMAETTFDVSNIYEDGIKVVILHFDETRQEWEYITTDTVENGLIQGDFSSYSPVAFVKITDGNYENITIEPGLYNSEGTLLCTWEQSGINISYDFSNNQSSNDYRKRTDSGYYVITKHYPTTKKVVIPPGTTHIGRCMFNRTDITSIIIPDGVVSIGAGLYQTNITEIHIPDSVTTLGNGLFKECKQLKHVRLPKNLEYIEDILFQSCTSLETVIIPLGITKIENDVFSGSSIKTIYFEGTEEQWNSIDKHVDWDKDTPEDMQIVYNYNYKY